MKISVKKDIGLGVKDSLPNFVSIRVQLPKEPPTIKPKITIPVIKKEEKILDKEIIQLPKIVEPVKQTYGIIHNEQPVIKLEPSKELNKDSILDKVETGFGCDNTLHKECPKPKFHQHLCKENFLSEFKIEIEKLLARDNLGVYSKLQIDLFLKDLTNIDTSSFITKDDFEAAILDLDFVKSSLKANTDYNIPENLFKL